MYMYMYMSIYIYIYIYVSIYTATHCYDEYHGHFKPIKTQADTDAASENTDSASN